MVNSSFFVLALGTAFLTATAHAQSSCPTRTRRAWSTYSTTEKQLYLNALNLAMAHGLHHKFVEVHMDPASEHEAHDCLFLYWHRRFLLAYENMLRSLGDEYECITLPYWDFWKLSANYQGQVCTYISDCNTLPLDLGAITPSDDNYQGPYADTYPQWAGWYYAINQDTWFQGTSCYRSTGNPSTSAFCQSQVDFDKNTCYKYVVVMIHASALLDHKTCSCIPRNDLTQATVPGLPLLFGQVFASQAGSDSFTYVTKGVQYNYHNGIHAAINSIMGTFASPSDPFFYIHHATVDALHSIYDKCVVKPKGANTADPKNRFQWPQTADWRTSGNPNDGIKRCWKSFSTVSSRKSTTYKFVDWVPTDDVLMHVMVNDGTYSRYVDVLDVDSPLRPYFASITDANGTILHTYKDFFDTNVGTNQYSYDFGSKTYGLGRLNDQCRSTVSSTVAVSFLDEQASPDELAALKQQRFQNDLYQFFKRKRVPEHKIVDQISLARCVYTNECLGGVFDYTDAFRENFRVHGSPECFTAIHRYASGEVALPDGWLQRFMQHYPCHSSAL
ncbi:Aste57867_11620 [Aphanomyces stellatus]|uniref:Aste57867_11620 protein n=1 Tax=Aphanomyces stellatus TaxID=120398 RepID=A0A485KUM6_9STRA|nr:hypothetical protein As57867_011577 [Aphanomyces stellatus]VFT88478.1 Aste57867_11620 [Aphanomyces stellatus]